LDDISQRNKVMTKTGLCSGENDWIRSFILSPQLVQNAKLSWDSASPKDEAVFKVLFHFFAFGNRMKDDNYWQFLLFSLDHFYNFGANGCSRKFSIYF